MPELPEVETIRRRLSELVVGKTIAAISVHREKSFQGSPGLLAGAKITALSRRSKIIQIDFDTPLHLLVHLKMTGQLIFDDGTRRVGGGHPTRDFTADLPSKHTRVSVEFSDKSKLFFNDMRVFGWLKVLEPAQLAQEYAGLALDIIDSQLLPEAFIAAAKRRSVPIKQVIMDNAVVAGVGNIYACDALSLARIHPQRPANTLSEAELNRLFSAMREVITLGIQHGGASISNYVTADGLSGTYQNVRLVYKREGEGCPHCTGIIEKLQIAGRGTFFCPKCQR
jgi:formamidopyrimidine-DNA glycosylase